MKDLVYVIPPQPEYTAPNLMGSTHEPEYTAPNLMGSTHESEYKAPGLTSSTVQSECTSPYTESPNHRLIQGDFKTMNQKIHEVISFK